MAYQHCPMCGTAVAWQQIQSDTAYVCQSPTCGFIFWQNSKPCVSIIIPRDETILLGTRGIAPEKGKLDLPGGFLKDGEHPFDGALREAQEELGVAISVDRIVGFAVDRYGDSENYTLNIGLLATIQDGTPRANDDVASLQWVALADIDWSALAFKNNEVLLKLWQSEAH